MMETPGTHLEREWTHMHAPDIAKSYWRLKENASMLDVIKQVKLCHRWRGGGGGGGRGGAN
jgi:hypothetical protein